jgi:membrane protein DedA with SNARE-associated domain
VTDGNASAPSETGPPGHDPVGSDVTTVPGAPSRAALATVVLSIIALVVANNIGNALAPALLPVPSDPAKSSNPLLLLALSPAMRNQIAVVNYVDPWWFMLIAGVRLLAADPLFFLLGRWYGDASITWMERRSAVAGEVVREIEKWFAKLGPLAVFVAANNAVCLLAGASGMRRSVFWVANIAGTVTRLLLIMWFADMLTSEIDTALDWVGDYRPWILGLSVLMVLVIAGRQLRRGGGQLGQLRRLGDTLDKPAQTTTQSDPDGLEVEQGVDTHGEAGQVGDPTHTEQDPGHER